MPVVVLGVVPAGGGGRLLAEVEGHGEFARGGLGVRDEKVEDRGLAHARLADEERGSAFETLDEAGAGRLGLARGGDRDDVVADRLEKAYGGRSLLGAFGKFGLVADDERGDACLMGGEKRPPDEPGVEGRAGREDDADEVDVGGERLDAPFVGAVEKVSALSDRLDGGDARDRFGALDDVAHNDVALLAAAVGFKHGAVLRRHEVVAAVACGDAACDEGAGSFGGRTVLAGRSFGHGTVAEVRERT